MRKKKKKLDENRVRVIKISKEAIGQSTKFDYDQQVKIDCKKAGNVIYIPAYYGIKQILNGCAGFLHIRFTVSKSFL